MGIASSILRAAFSAAFRRACHFLLSKRPLPPPSAAQICNDDVLDLILSHTSKNDLASLALTCKRWSPAAYRALYASVDFHPSFTGITLMEELAPTLIASEYVRHLIRHVELTCLEGTDERPSPDPLYDWLPLLPSDTVISLDVYTYRYNDIPVDAAQFMDTLLRSPMLNSIRHLRMTNGEAFFEGVNHMSQLLMSTPNVSHLSIDFPNTRDIETLPRYYAPFTPIPCRVRYLAVKMWGYTPLFGDLLKVTHGSLETLLCRAADAHRFQDEFRRARELTFSSPIQTLFFDAHNLEGEFPLLLFLPGSWPKLRQLVLGGWRMQWDALTSQLPSSLETLVLDYTFYEEFPVEQLTYFRCGVLLQLYDPPIHWPRLKDRDSWTLDTMLKDMRPALR
ncbi:hypothetical protein BDZ89DRAFT_1075812 [Hymenopellis radicata]|nr:hypothetical protein BDZ89DRAFT_1075812 [Hymenopellis radicata]